MRYCFVVVVMLCLFASAAAASRTIPALSGIVVSVLAFWSAVLFCVLGLYYYSAYRTRKYIRRIGIFDMPLALLTTFAAVHRITLPHIAIVMPVLHTGHDTEKAIHALAGLDYPKHLYKIFVILDDGGNQIVERIIEEINAGCQHCLVTCLHTPQFGNNSRAVSAVLQMLPQSPVWNDIDMIGIVGPEGNLHRNVLKEAAYRRLVHGSRILKAPVLPIVNTSVADHYIIDKELITRPEAFNGDISAEAADSFLLRIMDQHVRIDFLTSVNRPRVNHSLSSVYRACTKQTIQRSIRLFKKNYRSKALPKSKVTFYITYS